MSQAKINGMSQPMQVLTSHNSVEWYTPAYYVELVRDVLGSIDLDPASDVYGQSIVKANKYYDRFDDGLALPWYGNVFCNPPYGKSQANNASNQAMWASRAIDQFYMPDNDLKQAILLVNSTHGYSWYEELWRMFPVCCVQERIKFWYVNDDQQLVEGGQAKRGQTFVYIGRKNYNYGRFIDVFSRIGRIILP